MRMRKVTSKASSTLPVVALIALAAVLAIGVVSVMISYYQEDTHRSCLVTDKDRTRQTDANGNTSSDARVYTENCGVFQVADTLLKGQFNSSDTFGAIKVGETYDFTTIGWRFGPTSSFPNIIDVQPAS